MASNALHWIDTFGDLDGDGFVEYARQSPNGLVQQGWKDSRDSVFHSDGALADGPIALCGSGYVFAAKKGIAQVASALGRAERDRIAPGKKRKSSRSNLSKPSGAKGFPHMRLRWMVKSGDAKFVPPMQVSAFMAGLVLRNTPRQSRSNCYQRTDFRNGVYGRWLHPSCATARFRTTTARFGLMIMH